MTKTEYEKMQKRNDEILAKRKSGIPVQKIAEEYGLSRQWIMNLIAEENRRAERKKDPMFQAVYNLDLSRSGVTKLYCALKRNGIDSLDVLKDYTAEELLRKRCIGPMFVMLMNDAGMIKNT